MATRLVLAVLVCIYACNAALVFGTPPPEKIKVLIANSDICSDLYTAEGGYAKFAELALQLGFAVEGRRLSKFTDGVLGDADILILPLQSFVLSDGDIGALRQFVRNGGGVFVLGYCEDMFMANEHTLESLGRFISDYGVQFAASSSNDAMASVDKDSPLSSPHPAAEVRSPYLRELLGIDESKADAAAVFQDGGIHTAFSVHKGALGLGRLVVCGDANLATTDGPQPVIGMADNTNFLKNILIYLKGGADLGISMVKFRGKSATPGARVVVISRVKNFGNLSSGKGKVSVLLVSADDSQPSFELDPLKTVKIKPLAPGKSKKCKITVSIPLEVEEGEYLVLVKVEPKGNGGDTDPANNSMAGRKSLTIH